MQPPSTATDLACLIRAGDQGWDDARSTFNLLIDQQPEAIALPADEREVGAVVSFARQRGLRIAAQATGHNPGPLGSLAGTLILNTSRLSGVEIDAGERRVRVGAAARWEEVTPLLSELGLAALHGSSPDVGIVGYSLGGGIGWLARKHGMQANAVTAIELVTAEGHLVRTDATHEPDLFWALRGGNGNFGIVTAIEFEVQPVRELYAGAMFFPIDRGDEVLESWAALLPGLPEEITSWASLIQFPPVPEVPEPLRGRGMAVVMAAHLGDQREGEELLHPLRELQPEIDTFAMQPPGGLGELAMDPRDPLPFRMNHALLDELPSAAIHRLTETAHEGSPIVLLQLRHMGGALARSEDGSGARATLPGQISLLGLGLVAEPGDEPAVRADLDAISAAVAPSSAGAYPNFVEEPADASAFFDEQTWARLRDVKALYDPEDHFKGNHHIPPARSN